MPKYSGSRFKNVRISFFIPIYVPVQLIYFQQNKQLEDVLWTLWHADWHFWSVRNNQEIIRLLLH